jgi:uncharacterized membrane protein YbhN (UPF0104 family)
MEPPWGRLPDAGLFAKDESLQARWLRLSGLVLAVIVSAYAGAALWAGRAGWHVALTSLSLHDLSIIVGLVSIGVLLRACRWHCYIHLLQWNVPFPQSVSAFVASLALTATPAKSGELAKAALLRSHYPVSLSQGAGILLIERFGDLFAVVVLAIGGLTLFVDLWGYVLAGFIVFGSVVVAVVKCPAVLVRAQAIPALCNFSLNLMSMLDAVAVLMRPVPLLAGGTIALAAWTCEALALHYLVGRLGIHSSLLVSFSVYGLSTLAGAFSMLPGGLGSVEATMTFLLTRLVAPTSAAAVAVVIFRLCTLWLFSLIGAVFMAAWVYFIAKHRQSGLVAEAS